MSGVCWVRKRGGWREYVGSVGAGVVVHLVVGLAVQAALFGPWVELRAAARERLTALVIGSVLAYCAQVRRILIILSLIFHRGSSLCVRLIVQAIPHSRLLACSARQVGSLSPVFFSSGDPRESKLFLTDSLLV